MSEQLKHIFDKSACLSKRQLKDYVHGEMSAEESHALEHHLNSCFFCSEAIEGMMEFQDTAVTAADHLSNSFLKDHFSLSNPQVHLNSMAPSAAATPVIHSRRHHSKARTQPFIRTSGIAAIVIIGLGIMWYLEFRKNHRTQNLIAASELSAAAPANTAANTTAATVNEGKAVSVSDVSETMAKENPGNSNSDPQKLQPLLMADKSAPPEKKVEVSTATKVKAATEDSEANKISINQPSVSKAGAETERPVESSGAAATVYAPEKKESPLSVASDDDAEDVIPERAERAERAVPASRARKPVAAPESQDNGKTPDEFFFAGNWTKALQGYRQAISNGDDRLRQRAMFMAARCYVNLGQKTSAIPLLKALVDEGGSQKKAAKKLLKDLSPDAAE